MPYGRGRHGWSHELGLGIHLWSDRRRVIVQGGRIRLASRSGRVVESVPLLCPSLLDESVPRRARAFRLVRLLRWEVRRIVVIVVGQERSMLSTALEQDVKRRSELFRRGGWGSRSLARWREHFAGRGLKMLPEAMGWGCRGAIRSLLHDGRSICSPIFSCPRSIDAGPADLESDGMAR
jgi:hypothetical protein